MEEAGMLGTKVRGAYGVLANSVLGLRLHLCSSEAATTSPAAPMDVWDECCDRSVRGTTEQIFVAQELRSSLSTITHCLDLAPHSRPASVDRRFSTLSSPAQYLLTCTSARVKWAANKSVVSLEKKYHHMEYAALNLVRSADDSHPGCGTYASPEGGWRISRWRCSRAWWQWAGLWWPTRFSERLLFAPSGLRPF